MTLKVICIVNQNLYLQNHICTSVIFICFNRRCHPFIAHRYKRPCEPYLSFLVRLSTFHILNIFSDQTWDAWSVGKCILLLYIWGLVTYKEVKWVKQIPIFKNPKFQYLLVKLVSSRYIETPGYTFLWSQFTSVLYIVMYCRENFNCLHLQNI